ncbi:MAG: hypothetical protein LBR06_03495 [Bacteroidales bacterium]|jgi:hypothetical protein|nr:hypothetical protein [Bacteroidales bacterium]
MLLAIGMSACSTAPEKSDAPEPYKPLSGSFSGAKVPLSPDPLVAYRWANPLASDSLEIYTLEPENVVADSPDSVKIYSRSRMRVKGKCNLRFDFGRVSAAWFEFDADTVCGEIEMSISEYNEPAVFNAGSQHPVKTAKPTKYGRTYRLELNKELYEGVRFAWIHVKSLSKPTEIRNVRLVCQIKPTNYKGSFECSDETLTRIWYTGAYDVKLNLLHDYFGAILMERSDRHSWTGDAHPSQAAALVAFGNYEFIKANLRYTSTQFNGILSYSLYWALSLLDYYRYTGDKTFLKEMSEILDNKLDVALGHFHDVPNNGFYGWDERLGAGFENPNCQEVKNAYRMLCLRAWQEAAEIYEDASYREKALKYRSFVNHILSGNSFLFETYSIHAAADAVNAGVLPREKEAAVWQTAFADRQNRLSYSPFNQFFIIQAMARLNRYDEALTTIDDCWGGQLRYGGTTFFEVFRPSWNDISQPNDAPVNNQCGYTSLTHPWSAGVTKWLSEEILGVKPWLPGFKSFNVKPHLSAKVKWVKGSTPTPYGAVKVAFNIETGIGELTVPQRTTATFAVPKSGRSLKEVSFNDSIYTPKNEDDDFAYFQEIKEGEYKIKANYSGALKEPVSEPFTYQLAQPVSEDTVTQGNWKGKYGVKGYLLCNYDSLNHRISLPSFINDVAFSKNANIHLTGDDAPTDRRALVSPDDDSKRSLGAITTRDPIACLQTMTIDIPFNAPQLCRLSLYFADWERDGRRTAIEVFDLDDRTLLMPLIMVRNYGNGKYISFNIDRSVRIRINQVRGKNASLSALFID